ncbi:hypothetical protein C8A03DRAFT_15868 [Achaetomium macrosporum]|uniref:BZIP domain-containing protein n=1 Tax=Achaetomium macrosporum TaxID=79813 RepID=A0AAN7C9V3_9PEZI|nr:hypothetical protein C8A03DRAFT_15868 [Achaetomium macrosporum]
MERELLYRTRVHKFSCKPPGHDAARQRENQRRHRARVRNRITELEAALSNTQSRLDDALMRIDSLTSELQRLRGVLGSTSPTPQTQQIAPGKLVVESTDCSEGDIESIQSDQVTQEEPSVFNPSKEFGSALPKTCGTARGEGSEGSPVANSETIGSATQNLTPNISRHAIELPVSGIDNPNDDCPLLPPPGAGESTIPCRDAYSIIKERSTPEEVDLSFANEWLKPGFRRAIAPGAGCRVQTHLLFTFVDHITPI